MNECVENKKAFLPNEVLWLYIGFLEPVELCVPPDLYAKPSAVESPAVAVSRHLLGYCF